jgi:putative lipoic acid-binding regulatory protein
MRIFAFIFYYEMDKKSEEFYARLKQELTDYTLWPAEYLFKFIVPTEPGKIEEVENAFNNMGAVIETTQSKTGKYTSVSINVRMVSAQAVIDKYIQLSGIEGIISL